MNKTKIEYCDASWNPVVGCKHGCSYCYARKIAERFGGYSCGGSTTTFCPMRRAELSEPLLVMRKNGKTTAAPFPFGFEPTFMKYRLEEPQHTKKPKTIFVCDMADLFGSWIPDDWIRSVFDACKKAPQHTYLFLTKNPERYTQFGVPTDDNFWYGVSITRESEMHLFNSLPAFCNTFVSIEPILENLHPELHNILFKQVGWIILGAETGTHRGKIIPKEKMGKRYCRLYKRKQRSGFHEEQFTACGGARKFHTGKTISGQREGGCMLELTPITLRQANEFVAQYHRHHKPTVGHKFSIGVCQDGKLVGVCICGRPVSRFLDDGQTLEVNRLCTDGIKNACSILYGAAYRAAIAIGYKRVITYILESEPGTSLKAAGYICEGKAGGLEWSGKRRPKNENQYPHEMKTRWVKTQKNKGENT